MNQSVKSQFTFPSYIMCNKGMCYEIYNLQNYGDPILHKKHRICKKELNDMKFILHDPTAGLHPHTTFKTLAKHIHRSAWYE